MKCPICRKLAHETYKPFCSRRCADVDLGRWITGGYAIPGPELGAGLDEEEETRQGSDER